MFRNLKLILFLFSFLLCGHTLAVKEGARRIKVDSKSIVPDKSPSLLLQNTALVRLGGQVFFLNDVDRLQESYKRISCLGNKSYIERFLRSSNESLIPHPWQGNNINEGQQLPQQLEAFILIEKLKLSSVSSTNIKLSTLDLVKLAKDCSHFKWNDLNSDVKSLFLSEIYLRQRFSDSKDVDSALKEFVKSLNLQHTHELLRLRPSKLSLKALYERVRATQETKTPE